MERDASLRADEANLLARLGRLDTLRGPADLASLAALGYALPVHMLVSFHNMGVSFARPEAILEKEVRSGYPGVVIYRPNPAAVDVADPYRPAFPYELVGWGHGVRYTPGVVPTSRDLCVNPADWFVHEQGVHTLPTWGFAAQPPPERFRGEVPGEIFPLPLAAFGPTHGRFWDIHVWRDPAGGTPVVGIHRPFDHIAGLPMASDTSFFYPDR